MLRRSPGLVALACAVLVSLGAADARAAYENEYLGVNVQAMVKRGFAAETWPGFLGTAREGGFAVARHDAGWARVEPEAPRGGSHVYRWESLDRFVIATASAGMRWAPVLSVMPDWARDPDGRFTANHFADFAAFAAALTRRYGPGGDFWRAHPQLPVLPPKLYEVWNEPNSANAWNGVSEPAAYAALFAQVRQAVKDVDPNAAVVVSLGWQNTEQFITALSRSGYSGWTGDGIAFHPYAPTVLGIGVLIRILADALAANGRAGTPIYVNEIGWPRASGVPAAHAWDGSVSDETRAASLSLVGDALQRSDCNVPLYAPYSLVEPEQDPGDVEDWMGILHRDGSPTAAFTALRASARSAVSPPAGKLTMCGKAGTSDPKALLPLSLQASRTASGCFASEVRYGGNPLEQATLTAYRGDEYRYQETNSFGRATVCAPDGSEPIMLRAGIRDIGVSVVLGCPADRESCAPIPGAVVGDPAGGAAGGTRLTGATGDTGPAGPKSVQAGSRICGVQIVARGMARVRRGKTRLRVAAREACAPLNSRAKVKVRIYVVRSGGPPRLVRSAQLSRRPRTVTLPVRKGERQVLLVGRVGGSRGRKITRRIALQRP